MNKLNIIHLKKRVDRLSSFMIQLSNEKITDYLVWDGVEGKNPIANINAAWKQIIKHYKTIDAPYAIIAEDDFQFTGTNAWKYFLDNMPSDADLYVGSYYSGSHDENFIVKNFAGMTLVCVHKRYYDTFLSLPPDKHIDRAIAASGAKIITCYPFVATQVPGFSDQRKRMANDSHRLKDKILYNGE